MTYRAEEVATSKAYRQHHGRAIENAYKEGRDGFWRLVK
jgi:hypothetical protein